MAAYELSDDDFARLLGFVNPSLLSNNHADAQLQDNWNHDLSSSTFLDTLPASVNALTPVYQSETVPSHEDYDSTTPTTSATTEPPTGSDSSAFFYEPEIVQPLPEQESTTSSTQATNEPAIVLNPLDPFDALFCENEDVLSSILPDEEHQDTSTSISATNEPATISDPFQILDDVFDEHGIAQSTQDHEPTIGPLSSELESAAAINLLHTLEASSGKSEVAQQCDDCGNTFPHAGLTGEQPAVLNTFEDLFSELEPAQTQSDCESTLPPSSRISDSAAVPISLDDLFCETQTAQRESNLVIEAPFSTLDNGHDVEAQQNWPTFETPCPSPSMEPENLQPQENHDLVLPSSTSTSEPDAVQPRDNTTLEWPGFPSKSAINPFDVPFCEPGIVLPQSNHSPTQSSYLPIVHSPVNSGAGFTLINGIYTCISNPPQRQTLANIPHPPAPVFTSDWNSYNQLPSTLSYGSPLPNFPPLPLCATAADAASLRFDEYPDANTYTRFEIISDHHESLVGEPLLWVLEEYDVAEMVRRLPASARQAKDGTEKPHQTIAATFRKRKEDALNKRARRQDRWLEIRQVKREYEENAAALKGKTPKKERQQKCSNDRVKQGRVHKSSSAASLSPPSTSLAGDLWVENYLSEYGITSALNMPMPTAQSFLSFV